MKGKILVAGGKEVPFDDLYGIIIRARSKLWVLHEEKPTVLRFRPMTPGWRAKHGVAGYLVLKAWRRRNGFSQSKAAAMLGVSVSLVRKIEQGLRQLSVKLLDKIRNWSDNPLYMRTGRRGMVRIL